MLRLMDFGLLAVALVVVLGLVLAGPVESPPPEEHPIGAAEPPKQPKAS